MPFLQSVLGLGLVEPILAEYASAGLDEASQNDLLAEDASAEHDEVNQEALLTEGGAPPSVRQRFSVPIVLLLIVCTSCVGSGGSPWVAARFSLVGVCLLGLVVLADAFFSSPPYMGSLHLINCCLGAWLPVVCLANNFETGMVAEAVLGAIFASGLYALGCALNGERPLVDSSVGHEANCLFRTLCWVAAAAASWAIAVARWAAVAACWAVAAAARWAAVATCWVVVAAARQTAALIAYWAAAALGAAYHLGTQ